MKKLIFVIMTLSIASGCCILPESIPPSERNGQFYCYTRHAFDGEEERRCHFITLLLNPLVFDRINNNSGSWPNPGPIELLFALGMLPVAMIDPLVVTPTIDTVILPYDYYQRHVWQPKSDETSNK